MIDHFFSCVDYSELRRAIPSLPVGSACWGSLQTADDVAPSAGKRVAREKVCAHWSELHFECNRNTSLTLSCSLAKTARRKAMLKVKIGALVIGCALGASAFAGAPPGWHINGQQPPYRPSAVPQAAQPASTKPPYRPSIIISNPNG
jgi:hypothetical protein